MVLKIEAQGPWTVALGILLSFYLDFILVLPYFNFRPVMHKLQASSGKIGEAARVMWCQLYRLNIDSTAYICMVLRCTLCLMAKRDTLSTPIGKARRIRSANRLFLQICVFAALHLLAAHESQYPQYWCSIWEMKEQAKRRHLCTTLRLLLQNLPINFAAVTGNGKMFNTRRQQSKNINNAQHHSPRPLLNDWH